jgi:hypothetical protein
LEKERNEREMLQEIEKLKNKVYLMEATPNPNNNNYSGGSSSYQSSGGASGGRSDLETENRVLLEQNQRLLTEAINYKRIISQLELELNSVKDDNNHIKLNSLKEMKTLQEKYSLDLKEINMKNHEEIDLIEKRHKESLRSMKEIHVNEVASFQDRLKSIENLENLIKLITNTSYSMKGLEETLNFKHSSIQNMEKGYLESREKLLLDLETQAKDRMNIAEVEEYKMKGLLLHLESMIGSLRGNYLEEKNRLLHENQRLTVLQENLFKEKEIFESHKIKELNAVELAKRELDNVKLEFSKEKLIFQENFTNEKKMIEKQLKEKENEVLIMKRTTENKEFLFLEESKKFLSMKDEFLTEKRQFEEYKSNCSQELTVLEDSKKLLKKAITQLSSEKEEVYSLQQQVLQQKQQLELKERDLQQLNNSLAAKENVLNNSFQELSMAAAELANQERTLVGNIREIESKKKDMLVLDNEMIDKKLFYFQQFRENMISHPPMVSHQERMMNRQPTSPSNNSLIPLPLSSQPAAPINQPASYHPPNQFPSQRDMRNNNPMINNQNRNGPGGGLGNFSTKANDIDDGYNNYNNNNNSFSMASQIPMQQSFSSSPASVPVSYQYKENLPNPPQMDNNNGPQQNWSDQFKQQLKLAYAGNSSERLLPKEIQSAQRLLKENKFLREKQNHLEIRKFLDNENRFLSHLDLLHQQKKMI